MARLRCFWITLLCWHATSSSTTMPFFLLFVVFIWQDDKAFHIYLNQITSFLCHSRTRNSFNVTCWSIMNKVEGSSYFMFLHFVDFNLLLVIYWDRPTSPLFTFNNNKSHIRAHNHNSRTRTTLPHSKGHWVNTPSYDWFLIKPYCFIHKFNLF